MRFLANENFPGTALAALEAAGHDVVWVGIAAPGATDPEVLAWAVREERILLTFDKDFSELARGSQLPRTCGVVLLRMPMPGPGEVGQRPADLITVREDWAGYFSVID
jgi:predicted nuclease of predicted toxin-antitoxin system